jgi:hypothetical protein
MLANLSNGTTPSCVVYLTRVVSCRTIIVNAVSNKEISPKCPDRFWNPSGLQMVTGIYLGGKAAEA